MYALSFPHVIVQYVMDLSSERETNKNPSAASRTMTTATPVIFS